MNTFHNNQAMEKLSKCIVPIFKKSNKEDSKIFKMVDSYNISPKETAEQMGLSYSTFKSKLHPVSYTPLLWW